MKDIHIEISNIGLKNHDPRTIEKALITLDFEVQADFADVLTVGNDLINDIEKLLKEKYQIK